MLLIIIHSILIEILTNHSPTAVRVNVDLRAETKRRNSLIIITASIPNWNTSVARAYVWPSVGVAQFSLGRQQQQIINAAR